VRDAGYSQLATATGRPGWGEGTRRFYRPHEGGGRKNTAGHVMLQPTAATCRAQRVTRWRSMPSAAGVSLALRRSAKCRMIADRSTCWAGAVRDRASTARIERVSSVKDGAITLALRGMRDLPNCNQPCSWLTQSLEHCQRG
jgi:hypothetical protein